MTEMEKAVHFYCTFARIQSRLLISKPKCNIETLSVAVNLRKRLISNNLECLNRLIDEESNSFDNFIFTGDFNVSANHNSMINFCDLHGLKNLINVRTCYKILTVQPVLYQKIKPVTSSTIQYLKLVSQTSIYLL